MAARATPAVVRVAWLSLRFDRRVAAVSGVLALAAVAVSALSLTLGDFPLSLVEVARALLGRAGDDAAFIVGQLRAPRVAAGLLVGAALGAAGAAFQALVRNPLGSPDIVGFDRGAAVGAVAVMALLGPGRGGIALGAVCGGVLTALLVYVLGWKRGIRSYRLVLIGLGIGFVAAAAVDYLIIRADIRRVQQAVVWMTGSLNGRGWREVMVAGVALVALGPALAAAQRALDRLALGDEVGVGLGIPIARTKLLIVLTSVALAALAVAAAGPIGFVAFVSGPIARRLVDSPNANVVPAALVGALVTVSADLAARRLLGTAQLPVGIVTAAVGAPYLLWLLSRRTRTGRL